MRRGGGAPKRTYIGFGSGFCQPFRAHCTKESGNFCRFLPSAVWHFHHRRAPCPKVTAGFGQEFAQGFPRSFAQGAGLSANSPLIRTPQPCSAVLGGTLAVLLNRAWPHLAVLAALGRTCRTSLLGRTWATFLGRSLHNPSG